MREIVSVVLDAPGGFMILTREIRLGEQVFMVNASPILEPDGATSGVVAVFSDITGIKKLETAKSMFVSMVAHEVKNPLAAAEGWLNLVLTGAAKVDRDEERRMLERAMVRMRTLRAMVNELLSLTAIETGRFQLHRVPQDPAAVAAEVVEAHREKAAEKRVTLTVDGRDGRPRDDRARRPRRAGHHRGQPRRQRDQVHARGRIGRREHGTGRDVRDDRRARHGHRALRPRTGSGCSRSSTGCAASRPTASPARASASRW